MKLQHFKVPLNDFFFLPDFQISNYIYFVVSVILGLRMEENFSFVENLSVGTVMESFT